MVCAHAHMRWEIQLSSENNNLDMYTSRYAIVGVLSILDLIPVHVHITSGF
jgi:hypothetical protein